MGLGLLAGCLVVLLEDEDALGFLRAIETDFGARTKNKNEGLIRMVED